MYVLQCVVNNNAFYLRSNGVGTAALVSNIKDASFFEGIKEGTRLQITLENNETFDLKPIKIEQEKPSFGYSVKIKEVK